MKEFKIRASASWKLMGVKGIGKTGESYLQEWMLEQIYQRKKEFSSKYTEKGLIMEDNALDLVAEYLGLGMLLKNEEHYSNSVIMGTPDVVLNDLVIDVKCAWDCFTFPLFDTEIPNSDYYWQAQCYMNLTGRKDYKLIYCLMDTPEYLIEKEFKWNNFKDQDWEEFKKKFIYSDLPIEKRIKVFDIKYSESDVSKIHDRVYIAREYISSLSRNMVV